jgi:hypothetical protein
VRQPVAEAGLGVKLYPDLEAKLNDVTAVRIYGAGDKQAVGIEKSAAGWTVTERAGFPADVGRVRELLLALAKAKTIERKTAIATKLPALGTRGPHRTNGDGQAPRAHGHAATGVAHHRQIARRPFVVRAPRRRSAKLAGRCRAARRERPAALAAVENTPGAARRAYRLSKPS